MPTATLNRTSNSKITILGAIIAIIGAAGILRISTMLAFLLPQMAEGEFSFLSHQALFQIMWAVFAISLFITGISLIVSGAKNKKHDLVPGLTLYFLGASLMINGSLLFMYGHTLYAVVAILIGAIVTFLEWNTEVL
ncbi:MAG TPA: hypothetical protein DD827_11250 [Gammaproteobacteria bacterium]|nr:hypothetical protein [Gammaproteobacteria bacterium]